MKRIIYTALALATATIGCTKSNLVEVPAAQKTAITFDTYNGRVPVTKASEVTNDNVASIHVTGFHVPEGSSEPTSYTSKYMDVELTRSKTDDGWGSWGYGTLSYWPASGTLGFVAYGSNTPRTTTPEAGKLLPVDNSYAEFTYTVPDDVADQQDLVAGYVAPAAVPADGTVTLKMKHLLSRIGFKVRTVGAGSIKINNITLHGVFANEGTVNLAQATPAITATKGSKTTTSYSLFTEGQSFSATSTDEYTFEIYDNSNTEATDAQANRFMMLMPGKVSDFETANDGVPTYIKTNPYIYVDYELGGVKKDSYILFPSMSDEQGNDIGKTLRAGYAYEFVFTVSVAKIEFTGEVVDWDEDIDGDDESDEDDYIEL